MSLVDGATIDERFSSFSILQTDYKKVEGHGIRADFLIPKSIAAGGKMPVIIQFHGGGLVFGDSLYSIWFPMWVIQLAQKHSAVIVCANYRMMPESTVVEILDDVDEFWKWLHTDHVSRLLSSLSNPVQLDLDRVITTGESAGGFLSLYLALTFPNEIRSATSSYPMLNQERAVASDKGEVSYQLPIPSGIVSSATDDERYDLFRDIMDNKRLVSLFERGTSPVHRDRLSLFARLEKPDTILPPGGVVILHGAKDPVVPVVFSEKFVKAAREKLRGRQGADKIVLSVQMVEEGKHGFDVKVPLEEKWLQDALRVAVQTWLN